MNRQRLGGQIQSIVKLKEPLLPSRLDAHPAEKQALRSFTLTKKAREQTDIAGSATKKLVKKGGMHGLFLIEGRQETINTVFQKKNLLVCIFNKITNVQYVVMSQKLKEVFMLITAIKPVKFVGYCVTDVIRVLAHYEKTWQCLPKQLVI